MTQLMNAMRPATPTLLALCIVTALCIGCNDASAPGGSASPDNVTKPPANATATASATASAETATDPTAEPSASAATSAEPADTGKAGTTTGKGDGKKAEPEEKAGKVKGDQTAEAQYAVWLQSAGRYKVGKAASVQAVVVAKGAFKCNE
ncbi:MAG: hypothetical protein JRI68_02930, partial [Deltaproteobacteria bacterium]|nr:hypothetical protein [Deltaproteobacteria bacterium]